MSKQILVCLPLREEQKRAMQQAAPEAAFRFTVPADVTAEDVRWPMPYWAMCRWNSSGRTTVWNGSSPIRPGRTLIWPPVCCRNAVWSPMPPGLTALPSASGCWACGWGCRRISSSTVTARTAANGPHRPLRPQRVRFAGALRRHGDIGSNFARRAHALGAEVVGVRRTVHPDTPCPDYCLRVVPQSQMDAELPEADLVALSLPGTPETKHLFHRERIAKCKPGAILMNVGRGSVVDHMALYEAVHSGRLFGAALDVTEPEPLPSDHPLWREPGVIITPHVSGGFSLPKTLDNIADIFVHNLKKYAAGQPLDNQVNRKTLYVSGGAGERLLSTF